jgi:hypothetical protein
MARSLEHRPEMRGWVAACGTQRRRIAAKLATADRRRKRQRMEIDVTNDVDEPLTALSDSLDAFQLENRK